MQAPRESSSKYVAKNVPADVTNKVNVLPRLPSETSTKTVN